QRHRDGVGVAVDELVDGVVNDLPDEVVQAVLVHRADVHAGPLADRLQSLQDDNVAAVVPPVLRRNARHAQSSSKMSSPVIRHPGTAGSASATAPRSKTV